MSRFLTPRLASLEPYTPGEQPKGIRELLKLNTNENPYPPSPCVLEVLKAFDPAELVRYPDPDCAALKKALSEVYGREEACFTVGNGSDEVLAFCFLALCGRGAAFPDITYSFYPVLAELLGVCTTRIPLQGDFTWDPWDYGTCSQTLFIANPNAPTGIAAPRSAIEHLLEQDANRLVIVDEAYVDFGAESALPLLDTYENLLIVRTFSKSRSFAGGRAAFAIASPAVIADLEAVRFSFNPYDIDRITLAVAEAILRDGDYLSQICRRIIETREWTTGRLEALGFRVLPSATNFLFVEPVGMDATVYMAGLRERGILVRHFEDERIDGFVRVSIGTAEDMERFVATTEELLERS